MYLSRDCSKLFIMSFFCSGEISSCCIFRIFSMISVSAILLVDLIWWGWSMGRLLIVDIGIIMYVLGGSRSRCQQYRPDLLQTTESWLYFCSINAILLIFVVTNEKRADQPMRTVNSLCQPMRARYGDCCRSPPWNTHVDQNYLLQFAKLNIGDISEDLAIMATDREPLIGSNHPTLGGFVRYHIRSDREILSLTFIHTLPCSERWTQ